MRRERTCYHIAFNVIDVRSSLLLSLSDSETHVSKDVHDMRVAMNRSQRSRERDESWDPIIIVAEWMRAREHSREREDRISSCLPPSATHQAKMSEHQRLHNSVIESFRVVFCSLCKTVNQTCRVIRRERPPSEMYPWNRWYRNARACSMTDYVSSVCDSRFHEI